MKKVNHWILFMIAALLAACSAPMPTEDVGEVQEALGTCPRPTGGGGDTTGTADGYVTSIQADAAQPWRFKVYYRQTGSAFATLRYVDFGGVSVANSHANIFGPGWSSTGGSRIVDGYFFNNNDSMAIAAGCINDPNFKCLIVSEDLITYTPALYFDKRWSAPGSAHIPGVNGWTGIVGMGATLPQKLRFYLDFGTSVGSTTKVVEGPMLDACATP